jgi:5-deoxy-glucuronate isomerase
MEKMFGYPSFDDKGECILTTLDGEFKNMLMNITVFDLHQGEEKEFFFKDQEMAILLLEGAVLYQWNENEIEVDRPGFIVEGPYCLHVSCNNKVTIKVKRDCEILVQSTLNKKDFASHFYTPKDCQDVVSGEGLFEGKATRIVRTIFDYHIAPYSNMVMGEVISKQGGWSSYIPHHHPQPEVYYYRYERSEGFGACFIGDHAYKVKDKSFSAIPGGLTHPQVSAPGYPMYYCWMIRHIEGNPWTDRIDDPRYLWLLEEN